MAATRNDAATARSFRPRKEQRLDPTWKEPMETSPRSAVVGDRRTPALLMLALPGPLGAFRHGSSRSRAGPRLAWLEKGFSDEDCGFPQRNKGIRRRRRSAQSRGWRSPYGANTTCCASEKLNVVGLPFGSRYQYWKVQLVPAVMALALPLNGKLDRSTGKTTLPVGSERIGGSTRCTPPPASPALTHIQPLPNGAWLCWGP